jgi:3-methyl-2-oxobutanoate hydroxymethyltransferase
MMGLRTGRAPRFVKRYADLHGAALAGVQQYAAEVRAGVFPALEHTYAMPAEELAEFEDALVPTNPLFD